MADSDLPQWLDQVDIGTIAAFTLDDRKRVTAEVLEFNEERGELVVDVVSSSRSDPDDGQRRLAIPISRVVSVEPLPRAKQPWPFCDPCRRRSFSPTRLLLMATLFLSLVLVSLPLFLVLMNRPYGFQAASAIVYTVFIVFVTFSGTGSLRPYMFTCPAVRPQGPRLLWRHPCFLVALLALQTAALTVRPNLPDWWNTKSGATPFDIALLLLCLGLGYTQAFANRSLLDRAHREFNP